MSKFRGSAGLVAAKLVQVLLQVLAIRLYLQWLGQEQYGIVLLFTAISPYLALLDFGFTVAAQRRMTQELASGRAEGAQAAYRCLVFVNGCIAILTGVVFLGLFLWMPIRAEGIGSMDRMLLFLAAAIQYLASWFNFGLAAALMAYERFRRLAVLNSIASIVVVLLGIVATYTFRTPQALLMANAISAIAILAINAGFLRPVLKTFPFRGVWNRAIFVELRSVGLKSYVHRAIGGLATSTDRLLLGGAIGTETLAKYGVPARLPDTMYDALSPIYTTTLPELTRAVTHAPAEVPRIIERNALMVFGVVSAGLLIPCGFGAPILRVLFGEGFPGGEWICLFMGIYKALELYYATLAMVFYADGKADKLVPIALFNAVTTMALTIPSYHWFGLPGVAAMKAMITLVQFTPHIHIVRRRVSPERPMRSLTTKSLLLLACGAGGGYLAMIWSTSAPFSNSPWLALVAAPMTGCAYLALMIALRICPLPVGVERRLRNWRDARTNRAS